ncbi:MAG: hypothetical protein JWN26_140 [Candidatus Saccharibacteria bacterium]|nr:hypothetical protein [Candidatus Saccharibacteria bacterium]
MLPTSNEHTIETPIDTTTDQDVDYSAFNGGYEYSEPEYVPKGAKSIDVDPETIAEIEAAAGNLLDTDPNVRKKFARLLATAGGAVALSFLLAACGTNATPSPTPTVSASDVPTPIETQVPNTANLFTGELATTPDQISKYSNMSFADFKALQPSERTAFFLDKAKDPQKGLAAYAKLYTYVSGNSLDALPATISVDNTPQEILSIATYGQRFAISFDQPTAEKLLAGTIPDLTSNSYRTMDGVLQQYAPISARVLGAESTDGHGVLAGTFVSASEKKKDASGTYIDITTQLQDGSKVTAPYYYVTNGTSGMWEMSGSEAVK